MLANVFCWKKRYIKTSDTKIDNGMSTGCTFIRAFEYLDIEYLKSCSAIKTTALFTSKGFNVFLFIYLLSSQKKQKKQTYSGHIK